MVAHILVYPVGYTIYIQHCYNCKELTQTTTELWNVKQEKQQI